MLPAFCSDSGVTGLGGGLRVVGDRGKEGRDDRDTYGYAAAQRLW
jgi:hypothetical protein